MLTSISACLYVQYRYDLFGHCPFIAPSRPVPGFLQGTEKKSINSCQTILCCTYFYYKSKADDDEVEDSGLGWCLCERLATLSHSVGILRTFPSYIFPILLFSHSTHLHLFP